MTLAFIVIPFGRSLLPSCVIILAFGNVMTLGYVLAVFLMHESANVRETKVYPRVIDRGPGRAYSVRATTDLMNNAQIVSDGRSLTSANEHVNETESESTLKGTQTGTEKDKNGESSAFRSELTTFDQDSNIKPAFIEMNRNNIKKSVGSVQQKREATKIVPHHDEFQSWSAWADKGSPHGQLQHGPAVALSNERVNHLPFFIIGGAQKAGTTYLRFLLDQHPFLESGDGLHGEARGEPHFFDWAYPGKAASKSVVASTYSKYFHISRRQFSAVNGSVLFFDTTPAYLVEDAVPGRVKSLLPEMRLLFIVRDPTDRYRSELQMEICRARFGQISNQYHIHGKMSNYLNVERGTSLAKKPLRRGLYVDQFERWLRFFPRHNMLIITSDELYATPEKITSDVLHFLFRDTGSLDSSAFKFNFKAPRNAACKSDLSTFIDDQELEQLRSFYHEKNRRLPALLGVHFPWVN